MKAMLCLRHSCLEVRRWPGVSRKYRAERNSDREWPVNEWNCLELQQRHPSLFRVWNLVCRFQMRQFNSVTPVPEQHSSIFSYHGILTVSHWIKLKLCCRLTCPQITLIYQQQICLKDRGQSTHILQRLAATGECACSSAHSQPANLGAVLSLCLSVINLWDIWQKRVTKRWGWPTTRNVQQRTNKNTKSKIQIECK